MLAREKKRALWSLGVGLILAVTVEGAVRALAWHAEQRLKASIADCQKPDIYDTPEIRKHWGPAICEPSELRGGTTDDELIAAGGVSAQIIRNQQAAEQYRADEWLFSGILLVLSCLPLVWYFLLDRLGEISGAISGRDREKH